MGGMHVRGPWVVVVAVGMAACGGDDGGTIPSNPSPETGGTTGSSGTASTGGTGGNMAVGSGGLMSGGAPSGGVSGQPSSGGTTGTASKCEQFKRLLSDCYDGYCAAAGAAKPFCACWTQGKDIDTQSCACVPLNLDQICSVLNLDNVDLSRFDCGAAGTTVGNLCN